MLGLIALRMSKHRISGAETLSVRTPRTGMRESALYVDKEKYCQNKQLMRYPKREEDLEIMTNPKYLALLKKVKTKAFRFLSSFSRSSSLLG